MTAATVSEISAANSGEDETRRRGRGVEGFSGRALRDWRISCGMDQEALAAAAGVSGGQISHLEHDRRNPTIKTLNKLCAALSRPGRPCEPNLVRLPGLSVPPAAPGEAEG